MLLKNEGGSISMKKRILSAFAVGIVAVIVVVISDLFAMLSLGSFAWIAFILWNFTSKVTDDSSKSELIVRMLIGIPIGLILAVGMIHIPILFANNIVIKYLIVFLCNAIAVLFPGKFVPGIFFGIGLTFSGLGSGIMPNTLKDFMIILVVIISFCVLGMVAAWSSEKLQNINIKK